MKPLSVSIVCGCFVIAALSSIGCQKTTGSVQQDLQSADEIWKKMLDSYRDAKSYRDQAVVRLSYQQDGETVRDEADVSIRFQRPNKFRIQAYKTLVACDGQDFFARIEDQATRHIDGQMVVRTAPEKPTASDLLGDDLLRTQMGNGVLKGESLREPIQLELLFQDRPFERLMSNAKLVVDKDFENVDGHSCYRLRLVSPNGEYVFLIDRRSYLLRQLVYPAAALIDAMTSSPNIRDARLVAEFREASFNEPIDESLFTLNVPKDAKRVRFFVPPPQPLPSKLFGQVAKKFSLTELQNGTAIGEVTNESLLGKTSALLWFNNYASCEIALKQLDQTRQAIGDLKDVELIAVCTESEEVSHQQICDLVTQAQVNLRLCRDTRAHGRDVFQIEAVPTLVVLDSKGVVQVVHTGANTNLSQELLGVLRKIQSGEDVFKVVLARHQEDLDQYTRQLNVALRDSTDTKSLEIPVTPIAEKSAPKKLKLETLWESTELKSPGNLLVDARSGRPWRLFAIENSRTITEINEQGQLITSHNPNLPEKAKIDFLRSETGEQGQRFVVGFAPFGKQLFVFDEDWKTLLSYPAEDQSHEGLRDVRIADLDMTKTVDDTDAGPELYVGFWGAVGVQRVSLAGERQWSQRSTNNVLSLAITPRDEFGWRRILVAGENGKLLPVNRYGNPDAPIAVKNWAIHQILVHRSAPPESKYCGIAYAKDGNLVAVSLNDQFEEQWNYPLPAGLHTTAVEFVTDAQLLNDSSSEWVFAGADGSLHIVATNGDFSDFFHVGERITGLTTASQNSRRILIVSTPSRVIAWSVQGEDKKPSP